MRHVGAIGMPDTIRIAGGGCWAHRRLGGLRWAVAAACSFGATARARADAAIDLPTIDISAALAQLGRVEIATLALLLGILGFAVVTAASLVCTRRRLAASEAAAHDETIALKAEVDRPTALLRSEPQVLIARAAVADAPEVLGDPPPIPRPDPADAA